MNIRDIEDEDIRSYARSARIGNMVKDVDPRAFYEAIDIAMASHTEYNDPRSRGERLQDAVHVVTGDDRYNRDSRGRFATKENAQVRDNGSGFQIPRPPRGPTYAERVAKFGAAHEQYMKVRSRYGPDSEQAKHAARKALYAL